MNFFLEKKEKLIPNLDNKKTQIPLRKVKNLYKARIKIKKSIEYWKSNNQQSENLISNAKMNC